MGNLFIDQRGDVWQYRIAGKDMSNEKALIGDANTVPWL